MKGGGGLWIAVLVGLIAGTVVSLCLFIGRAWLRGESMDPRCVFHVRGYVDSHAIDNHGVMHVHCQYEYWTGGAP